MQPYTHPVVGALVGAVAFPSNPWAQAACIISAGLPDVPIALQVVVDKIKKRQEFSNEQEGSIWFLLKELSHSPLLWLISLAAGFFVGGTFGPILVAFAIGVFSHCFIDMLTHCGILFRPTDQSLAWPFYQMGLVPKLGGVFGIWEYRTNPPTLKPKKPEAIFFGAVLIAWGVITAIHYPFFVMIFGVSGIVLMTVGIVIVAMVGVSLADRAFGPIPPPPRYISTGGTGTALGADMGLDFPEGPSLFSLAREDESLEESAETDQRVGLGKKSDSR